MFGATLGSSFFFLLASPSCCSLSVCMYVFVGEFLGQKSPIASLRSAFNQLTFGLLNDEAVCR